MKNNYLRYIFILGVVVGLAALAFAFFRYFEPVAGIADQSTDIRLSDEQLLGDFETDLQQAELKYKNKVLEITGTVVKVECNSTHCKIIFDKKGKFIVVASCTEQASKEVIALEQNQQVTVKGVYTGYVVLDEQFMIPGEIKIDPCTLVK